MYCTVTGIGKYAVCVERENGQTTVECSDETWELLMRIRSGGAFVPHGSDDSMRASALVDAGLVCVDQLTPLGATYRAR